MSAEDIEYMDDYKEFPTKESALDWLDNYLSLDERNNLIKALEQEPCDDAISRQATLEPYKILKDTDTLCVGWIRANILQQKSVNPQEPKTGHCKDCKYFEYDSVAKVDGVPLIVAHEICSRWGDGCKTSEDGYCFMFECKENRR